MEHQIPPEDVRIGMYICRFGGPWLDHPFWRSQFLLKTARDLERVRESGVPYVLIDDELGAGLVPGRAAAGSAADDSRGSVRSSASALPRPRRTRSERTPPPSDRQRAKALIGRSKRVLSKAFADVRLGRAVELEEVTSIVDDVVGTVERNPHALLEVLRLKKKTEYTYLHSVAVCTLMVNAARHLGKGLAETRDYGLAGLLHDLGKMGIPDSILEKEGSLTDEEYLEIRNHPEFGYQVLARSPNIPAMALDVCRHHHEKLDGTGYPHGLPADAISMVTRLGAICDVYDALTSDRAYKGAWSPAEALAAMWSWEGHFDRSLLFTFMQSIGVFPPGLLVLLRSNRLALVLESKPSETGARVLAFFATRERALIEPEERGESGALAA
ncbi:MAG: hypothetical protein B7Z08_12635 [Sphingomonadales bacterium 32-68-7]|nr:MAG: hypothetical protein B7Z08_12635 [Sphingomonadales bacterium 32-68-7]